MNTTYVTTNAAVLDGYQSVFEPNKFNKCSLMAVIDDEHIEALEAERPGLLEWAKSKAKTSRVNTRLEPWEEVATGKYKVKFSWNPEIPVPVVDSNGTPIEQGIPLFSGSQVKLAFTQKPYAMTDSIGTSLRLKAIQVISCAGNGSVDGGISTEAAATLFGTSDGFKIDDPNVKFVEKEAVLEDNDF